VVGESGHPVNLRCIELSQDEVALLLQALEDAVAYRDARSHVVQSAVRRRERRAGGSSRLESDAGADHRDRVRAYEALALKLRTR
jgi:hypothetical protein